MIDWWMEPTYEEGSPNFPDTRFRGTRRKKNTWFIIRRGPISFQVSFARSKRGNRWKRDGTARRVAFTRQTRRHADVDSFECSSIRNFFLWNFEISGMSRTDRSQLDSRPSSSSSSRNFLYAEKKGKKKTFSRFVPLIGYNKHRQGNNDPGTIIYNIFNRTSYICIGIYRCVVYV